MTQELKKWNFSTVGTDVKYFPDSYKTYISLLSRDSSKKVNNCYSQNSEYNIINLWCAFLTAMNGEGVEGVIIDVESSSKAGKIVTSKGTTRVSEVILRNLLKTNGKKVLVGLFRGSCNSTIKGKRGIASFLNLFGDKNLKCTPQEAEAQIAYFPRYYFEQFYKTIRDSGVAGDVLEKIKKQLFVKYTEGNRLDYVFYYGSVKSSEDGSTTFRSGQGKMLRQPYGITDPMGSCEIIEGEWGRNVQQNGETYYDSNYVSGATLYRVSNSEQGEVEGVAVGGEWNNGRYYGGVCLSSSLNFGSGVEFNYTGRLVEKLSRPVAGIISFENAEKVVDSLVVRSFTSPWDKDKEHLKNNNDTGINIIVGDMSSPPKYVYVGGFDGNTFVHKGYGIILFVSGGFSYMYIGSIELSDYKYGVLYKISSSIFELEGSESGHPSAESSDKVCSATSIESFWGKFSSKEITAESRPFAEAFYKDKSGSAGVETDVSTASLYCKEALTNFSKIYQSYSSTFSEASNLGLTIALTLGEQYKQDWVHKFSEYRKIFEQSFGGVDKYIGFIRRCEKPGSGKKFNLVLPDISSSASPVVSSFSQPSFAQSSFSQPSFAQSPATPQHPATLQSSFGQSSFSQPSLAESPATESKWKKILEQNKHTSLYFGPKSSGSSLAQPIPSSTPPVNKSWAELLKSKNDPSSPFFIPGSQSQRPVLSRANSASPLGFTSPSPSPLGNVSSLHMSPSSSSQQQLLEQQQQQFQQQQLLEQQKQLLNLEQELQRQLQSQPQGQTSSALATQEFAKLVNGLITSNNDERRNLQEQYKLLELINLLKSKESQMSEFSPTTQGEIKQVIDEIKSQKEASEQMKKLKEQHKKELKEQKEIIRDLKLDKSNSELLRKIESLEKLVSSATMGSVAASASPVAAPMGSSVAAPMGSSAFGSPALSGPASSDTLLPQPVSNPVNDSEYSQSSSPNLKTTSAEMMREPVASVNVEPEVAEKEILLSSQCKRYAPKNTFSYWDDGYIALGQQFLGYGDSEEKALYRARMGRDSKKSEFFYYYAYPIKKCKADIETPQHVSTHTFGMYVTYEDFPLDSGKERKQIFAFNDVDIRDEFIKRINALRAKADADSAETAPEVASEVAPLASEVAPLASEVAPDAAPAPLASEVAPQVASEAASSKKRGPPPMTPPQQKAKALLQKKLREVIYCRKTLENLLQFKNLTSSTLNILNNDLVAEWYERCKTVESKLNDFISRLNAGSTSIPTDAELTGVVTDVKELLDNADIFKTAIIEVITNLPDSEDAGNTSLIKVAKLLVKKIQQDDKQYKESSVDSTTTDMKALEEEAEEANKQVEELVTFVDTLKEFYDTGSSSANKDNLEKAATCYTEMKSIVERIDECYKKAQAILGNVSVFDTAAKSAAQSSVNVIEKLKIKIYIAAAGGLATLATAMYQSALAADTVAIEAGAIISGYYKNDVDKNKLNVDADGFKKLKEKFDMAFSASQAISKVSLDACKTAREYLAVSTNMVTSVKDAKKNKDTLEAANKLLDEVENERKKLVQQDGNVKALKNQLEELQKYLDNVTAEFGKIDALQKEATELLTQLETAKTAGLEAFTKFSSIVNSGDSSQVNDARVAANSHYSNAARINDEIIKKISSAKTIADAIVSGAKFEFVKTKAEQDANILQSDTNDTVKEAEKKLKELQTKRNIVYKISKIDQLKQNYDEVVGPKDKDIVGYLNQITNLTEKIKKNNETVKVISDTKLLTYDKSDELVKLPLDDAELILQMKATISLADVALGQMKVLASEIQTLFKELEKSSTPEFIARKIDLKDYFTSSNAVSQQADITVNGMKKTLDEAIEKQESTAEIVSMYITIKKDEKEVDESYKRSLLQIAAKNESISETQKKVDAAIQIATYAYNRVMGITTGTILTSVDIENITQECKKVEESIKHLKGFMDEISKKNIPVAVSFVQTPLIKRISGILFPYRDNVTTALKQYQDYVSQQNRVINKNYESLISKITDSLDGSEGFDAKKDEMFRHVSTFEESHKQNNCNAFDTEFKFSKTKLSGSDTSKFKFENDDKKARVVSDSKLDDCLWLSADKGIPTDCDNNVTWAIKLSGTNFKHVCMGVGKGTFNPFTPDYITHFIASCGNEAKDFWGFSCTSVYNNGHVTKSSDGTYIQFENDSIVFFTLSRIDSSTACKLHMFGKSFKTVTLDIPIQDGMKYLYPVVRFKTIDLQYEFVKANENMVNVFVDDDLIKLKAAGFNAAELKNIGFDAPALKKATFTADELKKAGFDVVALKAAGFDADDLKNAGFGAVALYPYFTIEELDKAGFDAKGMKELVIKAINDIGIDELLKVNYNMSDLKDKFGFTAQELKDIRFKAAQLKEGGFSAQELKDIGFNAAQLKEGGFSAQELKGASFTAAQLKEGGFSAQELKDADFSASELKGAAFDSFTISKLFSSGSGGGRGPSAARKIHMTRRTRLRLKKSRVITRRPKSSHLHHVSNVSVGSTRKKRITNGSGKAISTRKI